MAIVEQLTNDLKQAMRDGNSVKRDTVRSLITMIKNEAIAQKVAITELSDESVQAVIKRARKQRDDARKQYADAGHVERADREYEEACVIAAYMPEQMSIEKIGEIVDSVIARGGTENFGSVMGRVMAQVGGSADGSVVREIVQKKMSDIQ